MTINGNTQIAVTNDPSQAEFQPSRRAQVNADSVQDSTRLSVDTQQTQKLQDAANRSPEVRQERVAQVRQAVAGGNYQVSNQQIAGAIADEYAQT